MITLRDRLDDLLGFGGIDRDRLIQLLLVLASHVSVQVASAFAAKLELAGGGYLKAAFARFVRFHLRHGSSAKQEIRLNEWFRRGL